MVHVHRHVTQEELMYGKHRVWSHASPDCPNASAEIVPHSGDTEHM